MLAREKTGVTFLCTLMHPLTGYFSGHGLSLRSTNMYVEKRGSLLYNQGVKERACMQARHALFQLWGAFPIMGLIAALQQQKPTPMPWGIVASWWLSRSKTSLSLSGMRQVQTWSTIMICRSQYLSCSK